MGTRIPSSKEMLTSATLVCRVPQAVPHQAARPSHPHCKSCLGDWLLVLGTGLPTYGPALGTEELLLKWWPAAERRSC